VERRPFADRIKWGNVARLAFVAGLAALVVWGPPRPGGAPPLPPDVGVSPRAPVDAPRLRERPQRRETPKRSPVRERRRYKKQNRHRGESHAVSEAPAPFAPPLAPRVEGGEFGP